MRDIAGSGGSAVSLKALLLMMFVVAMLFPVGPAAGETRISVNVYGNVTGPGGIPIVGAEVRVGSTDGSWNDGGYTNDTGYYKIYLPRPGAYRLEFLKDGYLNNFTGLDVPSYGGYVVSPEMAPLPVESETLNIGLFYLTRTSAVGKEVTATYHEGSHRYQYSGVTNASGSVSWDVFPADYKIEITEGGLLLAEEEIVVEEGVGTHQMDIGISELPPKDSLVKGYVRNSTGPMEDTVVAVMDPVTEITNFTETDEEGYFELGFWEGRHFLISMAETYESYFKSFELGAAETVWMNITMKEEKYSIHGDVRGPSGEFLKNISVQYFSENTFPEDNSDITNTKGEFGFKVAEGTGFLVISDGDPFEPGEFDVYFKRLNVSSNQTLRINMTGMDRFSLQTDLHFGNWSSFSSISKFFFPENNTMAIKAMVDLMVGDGDNYVTSDEIDAWYEFLTSEDQEIEEGPFGINTEENLTMDGRSFELIGERADISFLNFMGRVESPVKGIIQMDADYECDPFDAPFISHTLRTNISYSKENEDASLRLYYPPPAHLKDVEGTLHNVELPDVYPPQVTIIPVTDPDDDDDVDSEWVDLNLYNYTLEAVLRFNKDHSYVGEEEHFEVNITRDPLPNNTYSFGWTISIAGNDSNMTDVHSVVTEVPCLDHIFLEPGEYRVKVEITDGVGRRIWMHLGLNVYSEVPEVTLEIEGGWNQTFHEGDHILVTANITYGSEYPLTLKWGGLALYLEDTLNDTVLNRTYEYLVPDEGNYSVSITVFGDHSQITTMREFSAVNVAPTIEYEIMENGFPGDLEVMQGEVISINITVVLDPGVNDAVNDISWGGLDSSIDRFGSDELYVKEFMFLLNGNFTITINVSDDGGGFTIYALEFEVEVNGSFDQDGDGLPNWYEDLYNLSNDNPDDAYMDPDNDGWTTFQEFKNYTDPRKNDTDGDGIPDPWDENPLNEDILGFDTDGDGVSDWEEDKAGTDPNDPESYPGRKDKENDLTWIWLALIIAGVLLFIGGVIYTLARRNQSMMDPEE